MLAGSANGVLEEDVAGQEAELQRRRDDIARLRAECAALQQQQAPPAMPEPQE